MGSVESDNKVEVRENYRLERIKDFLNDAFAGRGPLELNVDNLFLGTSRIEDYSSNEPKVTLMVRSMESEARMMERGLPSGTDRFPVRGSMSCLLANIVGYLSFQRLIDGYKFLINNDHSASIAVVNIGNDQFIIDLRDRESSIRLADEGELNRGFVEDVDGFRQLVVFEATSAPIERGVFGGKLSGDKELKDTGVNVREKILKAIAANPDNFKVEID